MLVLIAVVVGFVMGALSGKVDFQIPPVGGKLILDESDPQELSYELKIYDKTGEKLKHMKRVLVDIEVKKNETNPD